MLLDLQQELQHLILANSPAPTLARLSSACKALQRLERAHRAQLWRALALTTWPQRQAWFDNGVLSGYVDDKARFKVLWCHNSLLFDPTNATELNDQFAFYLQLYGDETDENDHFVMDQGEKMHHFVTTVPAKIGLVPGLVILDTGLDHDDWTARFPSNSELGRIELFAHDKRAGTVARVCSIEAKYCEDGGAGEDDNQWWVMCHVTGDAQLDSKPDRLDAFLSVTFTPGDQKEVSRVQLDWVTGEDHELDLSEVAQLVVYAHALAGGELRTFSRQDMNTPLRID